MGILKRATISAIAILYFGLPVKAGLDFEMFGGMSGTTTAIWLFDSATESDGKVMEQAGESGLVSGEFGLGFDLSGSSAGLRTEGLIGRYRYKPFSSPSPAYLIYMAGAEPYLKFESFWLGGGGGVFKGLLWTEQPGKKFTDKKYHSGWAAWCSTGLTYEFIDFSARVRYHRFALINGKRNSGEFKQDVVAVFRASLRFNLL